LGPPPNISTYFEDTLETEPIAYLPGRLPMPQATGRARNDRNQRLATIREPHRRISSRVRCIALFAIGLNLGNRI
jgi:hypothetical protein